MKKVAAILLLAAQTVVASSAHTTQQIKRGAAIPSAAKAVPVGAVLAQPTVFANRTIVTEGVVRKVCPFAGCWMTVASPNGNGSMRVVFKGGAFVVPKNSGGQRVRLLGSVKVAGQKVTFVASGVELTE